MTGRYPHRYGLTNFNIKSGAPWAVPASERFMSEMFLDAGYATAVFG